MNKIQTKRTRTAFSLIELSMVVSIIAILVGVLALAGGSVYSNAKISRAKSLSASSPVKDISGLVLWLDAVADGSFITSEIIKPANQSYISTWYDLNTQNTPANATQTSPNQPLYMKKAINDLPGVSFSSASGIGMVISSNLSLTDNYTIFVVFASNVVGGARRAIQSQTNNWLIGPYGGYVAHYASGWVSQTVLPQISGKVYLAVALRTSLASEFYVNQVDVTANGSNITSPRTLALGASGANNEPLNGIIGEVIIYNRDLSDDERQDIENYLIKKWKIT